MKFRFTSFLFALLLSISSLYAQYTIDSTLQIPAFDHKIRGGVFNSFFTKYVFDVHSVVETDKALKYAAFLAETKRTGYEGEILPYDPADVRFDSVFVSESYFNIESKLAGLAKNALYAKRKYQLPPTNRIIDSLNTFPNIISLEYHPIIGEYIVKLLENTEALNGALGEYDNAYGLIYSELKNYGFPREYALLPLVLSGFDNYYRPADGSSGIWQIPYKYARAYQLEVNTFVDERRNLEKSTQAAVKYLADLYDVYNNNSLTFLAYVCGSANVNKAIKRAGGAEDYWSIRKFLPAETRDILPAFVALQYVYAFMNELQIEPALVSQPEIANLLATKKLHLLQLSEVLGIDIDELRFINPQYKVDIIPAINKIYAFSLPANKEELFKTLADSIYKHKDSIYLFPKETVINPEPSRKKRYDYMPPSIDGKDKIVYTVQSGDVLGSIASMYNISVADLKYWNNISRNLIKPGQKLVVYSAGKGKAAPSNKTTENKLTPVGEPVSYSAVIKHNPYADFVTYTIRKGDNIWTIAKKFPDVSADDIMKLNNLTHGTVKSLKPGDKIKIKPRK